jgi:hypothetical protein
MKENRQLSVKTNLTQFALDMGYTIETDAQSDCFHSGYSADQIIKMKLSLPTELANVDKVFPHAVAHALEDAERDAWAAAARKFRLQALKESLLKITLTQLDYTDINNNTIKSSGGILYVHIDEVNDEITLEMHNPEHLINAIVCGNGYMTEPLSSTEEESPEKIATTLHNLHKFFDVYGERLVAGEVPSQYSPDTDEEFFHSEVKHRISELDIQEVAKNVRNAAEKTDLEMKDIVQIASNLTEFTEDEIRTEIKDYYLTLSKKWS